MADDLAAERTPGFKAGEKKTIDEYQKLGKLGSEPEADKMCAPCVCDVNRFNWNVERSTTAFNAEDSLSLISTVASKIHSHYSCQTS